MATSEAEARKQFKSEITDDIEERDPYKKSRKVDDFDITQATPESDYKQELVARCHSIHRGCSYSRVRNGLLIFYKLSY
jgi:hypothetical protein